MYSVTIIGAGRVGGALALALPADKYHVENLIHRTRPSALELPEAILRAAADDPVISSQIVIIATQDSEIAGVAGNLASTLQNRPFVYHTSGALSSSILSELATRGCPVGSIHPLVSISTPAAGAASFRGIRFCIEGTSEAMIVAAEIAADLGGESFSIDTNFKTLYHAAAVTACGHLVALFDMSVEIMGKCGLSEADSRATLLPLVASTVRNLADQSTAAALTGTFARADIETFTRHLIALNQNVSEELLEIYLLLGERSLELAARKGVSSERIELLRTKVAIAKSKLR